MTMESAPMKASELGKYVCVPAGQCLFSPYSTIMADGVWVKTGTQFSSMHRDCFQSALAREALEEGHEHRYLRQLSIPVRFAGAVHGYDDYRGCTSCDHIVPAACVRPDGTVMTKDEYEETIKE